MRTPLLMALALVLALPASARADDAWRALAQRVDVSDQEAVTAARRQSETQSPRFWYVQHPTGALLSAMARDLSRTEVEALLERVGDEREAFKGLLHNLAARDDLAEMLVARGLLERLARTAPAEGIQVALERVVHGDPQLARRLLALPLTTRVLAEELADLPHAAGPRLLIDTLVDRQSLPPEARAALADVEPDLHNLWVRRHLGQEGVNALLAVATLDADPGLRVLAARLLHASLDLSVLPVILAAYQGARSQRIDRDEWQLLGKSYGLPPGTEALPEAERHDLLFGYVVRDHIRAAADPQGAAELAVEIRDLWRRLRTPQAQGHLLRFLDVHGWVFVDAQRPQPWGAPAWLELLAEWEQAASDPTAPLAPLLRGVLARAQHVLRTSAVGTSPPQRSWRLGRSPTALKTAELAQAALEAPAKPDLEAATRLLAGLPGEAEARAVLADIENYGPSVRLGPVEEDWPGARYPVDEPTRTQLAAALASEPDPWLVDRIANRLALAGSAADVALLARHAPRIALTDTRSRPPLSDLDVTTGEPGLLEALLAFVGSPDAPPGTAVEVYAGLVGQLLDPDTPEATGPLAERTTHLLEWTAAHVGRLDPDRAEGVLLAALEAPLDGDDHRWTRLQEIVRSAVTTLAVEGVRLRIARALTAAQASR